MRFSLILALTLAALAMAATAQKHQRPKAKATYTEEKAAKGSNRAAKPPATHTSAAQELHRVEQSSAKVSAAHRGQSGKQAGAGAALKAKKESNPPIRVAGGASGGHGGNKGKQAADSSKGRLRHKGSHH